MNIIEKIIANHSGKESVKPGEIVDIYIDARVARDFGGANVVKNIVDNKLSVDNPNKTFFTFGSDQKYAENQHYCRQFAQEYGIKVFDIDRGIGTHLAIDNGIAFPGSTFISTDSHANIMGAIGSFGQGMGDQDIAAAFANGKIWFKVPESVKINLIGKKPDNLNAKDIVLNLLSAFGSNKLLGYSVEIEGESIENLSLDERITISSMGTEMGAIIIMFAPSSEIINYCKQRSPVNFEPVFADKDANYKQIFNIDISTFKPSISMPGHPHDVNLLDNVINTKIDSAFIGSCTNGRIEDLRSAAQILEGNKIAKGIILKIVPATDDVWKQAMEEGLIKIFKDAGALVSNAGCAGCAAGQVGQNGPEEVTLSTGNRNFAGKQGKGLVYLTSPEIVAASAITGYITTPNNINKTTEVEHPKYNKFAKLKESAKTNIQKKDKLITEGRIWIIEKDDIDTDMIYHNRYLAITEIKEMGQYTFDNLKGFETFAKEAKPGDIVLTLKNFGCGSSRQQAVDCFISLGIEAIIAESYGAIYERNAINVAFPILTYSNYEIFKEIDLVNGDNIRLNFETGLLTNLKNNKSVNINSFSDVQKEIYIKGGLLGGGK